MPSPPAASSSSSNILLRNQKVFFLGRLVRFSRCFISRRYKSIVGQANESENAQDNAEKRLICWCPGVKIISPVYWVDRRSLSCSAVDQRSSVKSEPIRAASSHHAVLMRVRVIVLVTLLCNGVLHNPISKFSLARPPLPRTSPSLLLPPQLCLSGPVCQLLLPPQLRLFGPVCRPWLVFVYRQPIKHVKKPFFSFAVQRSDCRLNHLTNHSLNQTGKQRFSSTDRSCLLLARQRLLAQVTI
jgi:hypothetical protein